MNTDKRKSVANETFGGPSSNFLLFTDTKRRRSDQSVNPLTSIIEKSSERSQSSLRPATPNNTNNSGSSKISSLTELENVRSIRIAEYSRVKRKGKESIVISLKKLIFNYNEK